MGLLDLFARDATCPNCRNPNARKSLFGRVRCPNRSCENFDLALMHEQSAQFGAPGGARNDDLPDGAAPPRRMPAERREPPRRDPPFDPGADVIAVEYRNYRGEEAVFRGDRRTLRARGNHISLRVAPTGRRIALRRDRIHNLSEIEQHVAAGPTGRELRVLRYHARRGTTSPLLEKLRRKYPNWSTL